MIPVTRKRKAMDGDKDDVVDVVKDAGVFPVLMASNPNDGQAPVPAEATATTVTNVKGTVGIEIATKEAHASDKHGREDDENDGPRACPGTTANSSSRIVDGRVVRRSEDDTGPITYDGDKPQKRFYRARAHVNPLSHNDSFDYPKSPQDMDWSAHFPQKPGLKVSIVDVGCGFGGLAVELASLFPEEGILGMEIRVKVCEFVRLRIEALRQEHPGKYQNVSALRTNSMLLLPHFLERHQLEKMFFCFPDPHFKAKNHRRRIISEPLLTEYAFFLRPGGLIYMITDVEELHRWHVDKAEAHPCFAPVPRAEAEQDPAVKAMVEVTEEGKKVARMGGKKYWTVYRRIPDEEVPYALF